jgi:PAS domain S-box-containing protein
MFNQFVIPDLLSKRQFVALSVSAGLLILIAAWIIESGKMGIIFSLTDITAIHLRNPVMLFLLLFPFLLGFVAYHIYLFMENQQKQIKDLEKAVNSYISDTQKIAGFSEQIGNGFYDIELEINDPANTLNSSLNNLRDKLRQNQEKESLRNWELQGKEKISQVLRLHRDLYELSEDVLKSLIDYVGILQGVIYIFNEESAKLKITASYAYGRKKFLEDEIYVGEGLAGQAAIEKDIIYRTEIPEDYISISSGILGDKKPDSLLIIPLFMEDKLQGAFEFANIGTFSSYEIEFLKTVADIVARTIFNLKITDKTEKLLHESRAMTQELQQNEEQLRQNTEEMRVTQEELEKTNAHLEEKIQEVNQSQKRLYTLLENASELISIYDENKRLKYVSPSVRNIIGFTEDEIIAGKDNEQISAHARELIDNMFDELIRFPGKAQKIQYAFIHRDGSEIYLETTGRNLLANNAINGIILNTSEITERKRAEKEQRMRGQMQTLSDNSPDIILRIDTNKDVFYANPALQYYTGIEKSVVLHKHIQQIGLPAELTRNVEKIAERVMKSKKKVSKEISFESSSERRVMSLNAIPEFNDESHIETILFILHDITGLSLIQQEIKQKNTKITDSINYAFRLQNAIMPSQRLMKQCFPDSFMLYLPRDIVSGDFPWIYRKGDITYIAAVDCTGHGVPGAMLSLIGFFILNQIVSQPGELSPEEILTLLHQGVKDTLRQNMEGANAKDGMDVALCKIDNKTLEAEFAGAHRPLYHVQNGMLNEFKGTRAAIGGIAMPGKPEPKFKNHKLSLKKGDCIYMFSDGLPDQFGGPDGEKYFPKRIKNRITENHGTNMSEMYKLFNNDYKNWLGKGNQIDDILMIGIRF